MEHIPGSGISGRGSDGREGIPLRCGCSSRGITGRKWLQSKKRQPWLFKGRTQSSGLQSNGCQPWLLPFCEGAGMGVDDAISGVKGGGNDLCNECIWQNYPVSSISKLLL